MVHLFFQNISSQPFLAEQYASSRPQSVQFTKLFAIFFPDGGYENYGENLCSWLDVISCHFSFDEDCPHPYVVNLVEKLFSLLNIPNEPRHPDNIHVFHFWLYLHYVFWELVKTPYNRDDKVFQFMTGFPIQETRVIIVGNDPSPKVESSGFAFHGSQTESTEQMLDFLSQEMRWASEYLGNSELKIKYLELSEAKKTGNLNGWIKQGVLLINSNLTYCLSGRNYDTMRMVWVEITTFLLGYICKSKEHLAILLLGKDARFMENWIDKSKHLVMPLYHPSYYRHKSFQLRSIDHDWGAAFPFLNINLFLRRYLGREAVIDFNSISATNEEAITRKNQLEILFQSIITKIPDRWTFVSVRIADDLILEKMSETNVQLKRRRRFRQIIEAASSSSHLF